MKPFMAVVLTVLLVSCAPQTDLQGLKDRVAEYNKVTAEAMMAGDTEGPLAYYDENAISMPSNSPMLKGKAAIAQWTKEMAAMGVKFNKVEFSEVQIEASGSLGYEVGTYDMEMEIGGMAVPDKGKNVCVWKQQQDGSWKVLVETWNTDMPMPEPPPPPSKSKK